MSSVCPFDQREFLLMKFDYERYPLLETHMEAITALAAKGRSFLIRDDDGETIAMIGLQQVWTGVCNVFIVPSISAHTIKKVAFIKCVHTIRKQIDKWIGDLGIHRLQTSTPYDDTHKRWMEKLGFTCEGVLEMYGPDKKDHLMWSLLWA